MNYSDMFAMLGSSNDPYDGQFDNPHSEFPTFPSAPSGFDMSYQAAPAPMSWEEAFNGFKTRPVLYNMDGWISPFASNNWGGTSNILAYIDEQYKLPMGESKIDPNRIFTAEVNGLRALSADQAKILKMFEKKLAESLTEKGKVGLTEEDIEAMAAITSARAALTNIEKEKVAIKKNIADIKIKQAQNTDAPAATGAGPRSMTSSSDIGRNILDNIFAAPGMSAATTPIVSEVDYSTSGVSAGQEIIDNLLGTGPTGAILAEKHGMRPLVVIGEDGHAEDVIVVDKDNVQVKDIPAGFEVPTLESLGEIHPETNTIDWEGARQVETISKAAVEASEE